MMTREENDLLTQTDAGTPCGELMRRYWQPAALSEELPPGGAPLPVRLLGEDLVLFRDDQGRPGLLDIHCPHRGADLSYGRLEDNGLRCIYHGWLFDIHGSCRDQPGEPGGGEHKNSIRLRSYPCQEKAGVIFAYLGPGKAPLLPNYEFLTARADHVFATKTFLDCNYLQGNEGNYDPVHVGFVHRNLQQDHPVWPVPSVIEVESANFGLLQYAIREAGGDKHYLRVLNFIYPNLSAFATQLEGKPAPTTCVSVNWHVPIDDTHHWKYTFIFNRHTSLNDEVMRRGRHDMTHDYKPLRNKSNRYMQDRESMKTKSYSGLGSYFQTHDACATEGAGPIQDRTKEHLSSSDKVIVAVRKLLLRAIRDVRAGQDPPHVIRSPELNQFPNMVVIGEIMPSGADWREYTKKMTGERV